MNVITRRRKPSGRYLTCWVLFIWYLRRKSSSFRSGVDILKGQDKREYGLRLLGFIVRNIPWIFCHVETLHVL